MLDTYKILTVTHRQINVSNIGDFVLKYNSSEELNHQLHHLKTTFHFDEIMYLATCNRVMYFFSTKEEITPAFQYNFFKAINSDLDASQIEESVKLYEGNVALEHLFAVAASTDSMVVGEREILRQIREAYAQSKEMGLTGDDIRLAIDTAVVASKDVYSNTRIGEKPISVASLAAQRLLDFHLPRDARILMIGAGQTNMLVSKFLVKYNFTNVTVSNRSIGKAETLAASLGGKAIALTDLEAYKKGFDCMIVCTGATEPIITEDIYQGLLGKDTDIKLIIDLSIPNNVDKVFLSEFNAEYVEVEDIRAMAKVNLSFRQAEVKKAHKILDQYLNEFPMLYSQRRIEKAMRTVPSEIKAIKSHAMNHVFKNEVDALDEDTKELLERMMTYMEKRCIGIPMKAAREVVIQ